MKKILLSQFNLILYHLIFIFSSLALLSSCGQKGVSELVSSSRIPASDSLSPANDEGSSSALTEMSQDLKSMSSVNLNGLSNQEIFSFADAVYIKSSYFLQQPVTSVDYQVVLNYFLSLFSGLVQQLNLCALDLSNPDQAQCRVYLEKVESRIQDLQNLGAYADCQSIIQIFLNSVNGQSAQLSPISCDGLFDYYRNTCLKSTNTGTNQPNSATLCNEAAKSCYTEAANRLFCSGNFPWQ
ncbi:MAG: hypothetical protein QE271_07515 [Bacteriovoracaceae bacterium]|nr:hypothetical protein [Bacteriovoracaceae bacterium]